MQAPKFEQLSPIDPHVSHVSPAGAHAVPEVCVQTLPVQHPVGHDVALHVHTVRTHACPAPHAVKPLHVQTPAVHPSAVASHGLHVPPPAPHSVTDGTRHCEPEQQPVGHVVALQLAQLPPLQNGSLPWHELQVPPPDPQYMVELPVSH